MYDQTTIMHNNATDTGGGAYIYHSELFCQYEGALYFYGNVASNKGGGVHAINSYVTVFSDVDEPSSLHFIRNVAHLGGGIYLESTAGISVQIRSASLTLSSKPTYLSFVENSAEYGGAIYVTDETNIGTCTGHDYSPHSSDVCFLQATNSRDIELNFSSNQAKLGSTLYGGLLDRCKVTLYPIMMYGMTFFEKVSGTHDVSQISSRPV